MFEKFTEIVFIHMQTGSQLFQSDPLRIMLPDVFKHRAERVFLGRLPADIVSGRDKRLFGKQNFQNLQQNDLDGKRGRNSGVSTVIQLFCPGDELPDFGGSIRIKRVPGRKHQFAGEERFQIVVLADVILGEAEQFQPENQSVMMGNVTVAKQGVRCPWIDETDLTGGQKLCVGFCPQRDVSLRHVQKFRLIMPVIRGKILTAGVILGERLKRKLRRSVFGFFLEVNFVHVFSHFLINNRIISEYCTYLE